MTPRIPIMDVHPVVEGGAFAAKAAIGETIPVLATVFREGHDALGAEVVLTDPQGRDRAPVRMRAAGPPDRYVAHVTPDDEGAWSFRVQSWSDPVATWQHDAAIKIAAGVDVELMLVEGAALLTRAAADLPTGAGAEQRVLDDAVQLLDDTRLPVEVRLAAGTSPEVDAVLAHHPLRDLLGASRSYPVFADRERALVGSWYEFFPRSEGAHVDEQGRVVPGTLRTAAERLPAVAAMGFDVIYLPPVHPIGRVNRKGPNNTLDPGPDDPGSPWAIGSVEGGHDAIHPDLGTFEDFENFVAVARDNGLEVAIDLALQCAPDHPWVSKHPEWFTTRADGSIAYAENPPKKYQDIYPLNFDNDPDGLYAEVLRVVRLWMGHGVRIFRVDNPHTKPVPFWEWLLGEIRRTDPDVVFLSEAFTRPAMMRGLGTVGFHQSYTYFTWRNESAELAEYLYELSHDSSHVLRPNLFVNTPDILSAYLQYGGPAAFKVRATLAATGSPTWGVYAGFELYEHVAVRPGSEEYLDSEKYQVRVRDWADADRTGRTLAPYLTRLNQIRRAHPALRRLRNLTRHASDNDQILCFSKRTTGAERDDDTVIVVVNVDPHHTQETTVHLDMPGLGMDWTDGFRVYDEITGQSWHWAEHAYVRLDPGHEPAHILHVWKST
ncbi:MAG TPA: alpha-1,4-glucan--maltose-1-phosphate maltosyltransferase [Nocardioidaceae bacterium]|nr:alpha-1,4-glucan--maltose-1-phosphate maltosyltransferase [Nocardioidaceae bacterium]